MYSRTNTVPYYVRSYCSNFAVYWMESVRMLSNVHEKWPALMPSTKLLCSHLCIVILLYCTIIKVARSWQQPSEHDWPEGVMIPLLADRSLLVSMCIYTGVPSNPLSEFSFNEPTPQLLSFWWRDVHMNPGRQLHSHITLMDAVSSMWVTHTRISQCCNCDVWFHRTRVSITLREYGDRPREHIWPRDLLSL